MLSSVIRAADSVCTAALAAPATTALMLVRVDAADVADPAALVPDVADAVWLTSAAAAESPAAFLAVVAIPAWVEAVVALPAAVLALLAALLA